MAKNGFRVLDSDLHTMEPDGLWERYLDAPFKKFAPQFRARHGDRAEPAHHPDRRPRARRDVQAPAHRAVGKDLHHRAFARSPHYAVAHARGYDAESHVQAMDIEGIDVAVLYGTRGRQVLMHDDLDPEVAGCAGARPQQLDPRLLSVRARAPEVRGAGRLPRPRASPPGRRGAPCASWARWPSSATLTPSTAGTSTTRSSSRCGTPSRSSASGRLPSHRPVLAAR